MRYVVLFLVFFLANCGTPVQADGGVVVDELLTEVQKTLVRVRDATEDQDLPPIKKVTLRLKSSLIQQLNGKVSLIIIEFGANVASESVQEIKLELEPPRASDEAKVGDISDALADAIVEAAKSVKLAAERPPPLHLSKLVATIRFVVTTDGGGGVSFQIVPVTLDIGGKVSSVSLQEAILEFSK